MKNSLVATYMNDFQCLGSSCEDTCCSGWAVEIDKKTFVKYKQLTDKRMKRQLAQHIKRNKYETTFSDYATIRFNENGFCPLLNKDKLCSIQLQLGESYLSRTCASYPRQQNMTFESFELSGALSCPEIARLALLNPEGIKFAEMPGSPKDPALDKSFADERFLPFFASLRSFMTSLLQKRTMTIEERLLLLGFFLWELSKIEEQERFAEIPALLESYGRLADDPKQAAAFCNQALQDGLNRHKRMTHSAAHSAVGSDSPASARTGENGPRLDFQLKFLRTMIDSYVSVNQTNSRYQKCYQEMVEAIGNSAELYEQAYQSYFQPFMKEYGYTLENYLVNYLFSKLFPFFSNRTIYDEYIMLVLHYALIKMHLIGLAAYHQGLTPELVVILIQSFARTYEHDLNFFRDALDSLYAGELYTMPYMAVLLGR